MEPDQAPTRFQKVSSLQPRRLSHKLMRLEGLERRKEIMEKFGIQYRYSGLVRVLVFTLRHILNMFYKTTGRPKLVWNIVATLKF